MIRQLATQHSMSQVDIRNIVQGTFDAIIDAISSHGRIELRNFGVFEVKERRARKARNPKTGVEVYVPPKNVVTFKPGRLMEDRIRKDGDGTAIPEPEPELMTPPIQTPGSEFAETRASRNR